MEARAAAEKESSLADLLEMEADAERALAGEAGTEVTVKGWVRTRRDSKAGLSFIALHDGTCHDAIQIVAKNDLPNYESEIAKLTTGCAIEADGVLAESDASLSASAESAAGAAA